MKIIKYSNYVTVVEYNNIKYGRSVRNKEYHWVHYGYEISLIAVEELENQYQNCLREYKLKNILDESY